MKRNAKILWLSVGFAIVLLGLTQCSDDDNPTGGSGPLGTGDTTGYILASHTATEDFDLIPSATVTAIQTGLNFYYGHTSHGSQIMTGLDLVEAEFSTLAQPAFHEVGDDLGHRVQHGHVVLVRRVLGQHC